MPVFRRISRLKCPHCRNFARQNWRARRQSVPSFVGFKQFWPVLFVYCRPARLSVHSLTDTRQKNPYITSGNFMALWSSLWAPTAVEQIVRSTLHFATQLGDIQPSTKANWSILPWHSLRDINWYHRNWIPTWGYVAELGPLRRFWRCVQFALTTVHGPTWPLH